MRKTSGVTDVQFPFTDDRVPFVLVFEEASTAKEGRGFEHASTAEKKRDLVVETIRYQEEGGGCHLLAAWPGAKRTDVFEVDDLDEALAAFG